MRKIVIGVVVAAVTSASALAQAPQPLNRGPVARARTPETLKKLNLRIPELSFTEAPLEQVMDWLQDFTQMNVTVRWQVLEDAGISRDKPISLRAKNLRLSQVLWMIMNEAGGTEVKLAYQATGNLLVLSTNEDLGQEMVVKVYDVSDLLFEPQRFTNAPQIDLQQLAQIASQASQAIQNVGFGQGGQAGGFGGGGGGGQSIFQNGQGQGEDNYDPEAKIQELINLITQAIDPDSWEANGGPGTIHVFNQQLVVRNSILVHQRLGGYISE